MGKVVLVIALAAIVSCYAAADKKRVRKSEQGQVLGFLLYYGTGANENCERFISGQTIIEANESVTYNFNEMDFERVKFYRLKTDKNFKSLSFNLKSSNCKVYIEQFGCNSNRVLQNSSLSCGQTFSLIGNSAMTCNSISTSTSLKLQIYLIKNDFSSSTCELALIQGI